MIRHDPSQLARIAEEAMRERGFIVPTPANAIAEASQARPPLAENPGNGIRDLRQMEWTSIDNPESRDLDQIEAAEETAGGYRLWVGIADVDAYLPVGSALESFAAQNTTSVYTGVRTFSMLPEKLSFDVTSLVPDQPRLAVVVETQIDKEGRIGKCELTLALVENHAKLDYPSVSAWLDGKSGPPGRLANEPRLRAQLELQDRMATTLYAARKRDGALDVDTAEVRAQTDAAGEVVRLVSHVQDRAGKIIEELMIATNRAVALTLDEHGFPSLRRVVKRPERWARVVAYAAEHGVKLPAEPDSRALSSFADQMRREHPDDFPEISVTLVKLIGRGEYAAHAKGDPEIGHFGLATMAYTHATAPNRRYPDLVTQRLLKAVIANQPSPFSLHQLDAVAKHCTEQGAAADKVARRVHKSAAAALLSTRIGESFSGVITGASSKGTYVRVLDPPVEGKVVRGAEGLLVGAKVQVRLLGTDVERGFIDFETMRHG